MRAKNIWIDIQRRLIAVSQMLCSHLSSDGGSLLRNSMNAPILGLILLLTQILLVLLKVKARNCGYKRRKLTFAQGCMVFPWAIEWEVQPFRMGFRAAATPHRKERRAVSGWGFWVTRHVLLRGGTRYAGEIISIGWPRNGTTFLRLSGSGCRREQGLGFSA